MTIVTEFGFEDASDLGNRAHCLIFPSSSRKSDAQQAGFSGRTAYIARYRKQFRKRHQPSSDHRQATLRTSQAMENRYECIQNPDRRSAAFNGNDIIRLRGLVLCRSGARRICINVSQSRRAEWRRIDAGRANGSRAVRWRGSGVRSGPHLQPPRASVSGGNTQRQIAASPCLSVTPLGVRPRHAAHPAVRSLDRYHRLRTFVRDDGVERSPRSGAGDGSILRTPL